MGNKEELVAYLKKLKQFFKINIKKARMNFASWERIKNPPNWVMDAGGPIEVKASHDPFKIYWIRLKGKSFLYKVVTKNIGQGHCSTKYYRKTKIV